MTVWDPPNRLRFSTAANEPVLHVICPSRFQKEKKKKEKKEDFFSFSYFLVEAVTTRAELTL